MCSEESLKKKTQTRKNLKQETLKKISLEKLPRILLETKKQKKKNPKISMRKTHTFLEKFGPKSVNREDSVCQLIHPHGAAKLPN